MNISETQTFEDLLRVLFRFEAGHFIGIDKIVSNMFKSFREDDITSYINENCFEGNAYRDIAREILFVESFDLVFNQSQQQSKGKQQVQSSKKNKYELLEIIQVSYWPQSQ